jgi:predicted porin
MKKSLIALAVLAAAGAASAQSSVTLGGILKEGVGRTSLSNATAPLPAGYTNTSNTAIIDGSSRLLISGVEDLGGGLSAYFQLDTRFKMDDNGNTGTANGTLLGGNSFVGLRGGWGSFQMGRLDTHYCTSVNDDIAGNGTAIALQASSCALQGYVNGSSAGRTIAVTSRAQNTLRYTTPNLAGFTGQLSYSFNPYGAERTATAAGAAGSRAGNSTQLGLNYDQGPLSARFSYWTFKPTGVIGATTGAEGAGSTPAGQRAWLVGVGYNFGIAKVGLTYDRSQLRDLTAASGVPGADTATRNVWILPVTVPVGPGALIASYARASNVKLGVGGTVANSGANLLSIGYNYPLSKRTSVGASWSRLNNNTAGQYQLYTNSSLGHASGLAGNIMPAGADQTLIYLGVRHVF